MTDEHFNERYLIQLDVWERDFAVRSVAVDRLLGREVLVTRLTGKVGRRAAVQDRFRAAARSAVRLSHPNVVALYDIGATGGMPFAIQEHSHSESLSDVIEHEGPFHPDDVAVLVEHVADALDYAEQRGVPHLALEPAAITVDYDGLVLVSDFGIGQVLQEIAPSGMSTLRYRAPEQISLRSGDYRSDIYSLGLISYEMLTGEFPFDMSSIEDLRESILASSPRSAIAASPDIPAAVSRVVMTALSGDPAERFESAGHFAEALRDWREQVPDTRARTQRPTTTAARTEPLAQLPVTESDITVDIAEHGDGPRSNRRAAFAAWLAIGVALASLIWIAISLLDLRGSADNNPAVGQSTASPTETVAVTPSAPAAPTAISLIGLTVDEARSKTGIPIRVSATEASNSIETGSIIRQSPNPGSPVRANELVVVVSRGAEPTPIPLANLSVDGQTFGQVASQLISMGLIVSQVQEGSGDVPEGQIIRLEEDQAVPGDTVHVVVSMGDRAQIPADLQSKPLAEVTRELTDLGFAVGEPIAVSKTRIESFGVDLAALEIADGDVVGIQEADAGFGQWIQRGATITPVYYDASLSE